MTSGRGDVVPFLMMVMLIVIFLYYEFIAKDVFINNGDGIMSLSGWGKIRHPGSSHHTLQQAKLPPVDQEQCKRKLAQSPGTYKHTYVLLFLG